MLTKMTNARKISVKMKAQWAKELEETGFLACPISGCSQRYVSMANFTTHYKWCSGEKNFGVCPYCESVIFSDRKSTLHHMEVEHPDKIDEYKANYMIVEIEEPEEACAGTSSEVTSFDDESSDMYVEEVTSKCQKAGRKPKDKRFYSKENHLSPKRKFFRNKNMKNINETVSENIKEFQKCVRFDSIVSKINSVSDSSRTSELFQEATVVKPPRKQGERKPRYILTGNMGEEPSYFDDDLQSTSDPTVVPDDPATVKLTTKSKLVLDLQRYKRYNEYLKWTRDWGSERKTYSRSKPSERSHNSTITTCLSSDSFEIQDIHQLMEVPEISHISLTEEDIPQIDEQDLPESSDPVVTAKEVSIFQQNLNVDMDGDIIAGNIRTPLMKENHSEISLLTEPVRDEFSVALNRAQYESLIDEPSLPVQMNIFNISPWAGQKTIKDVSPCAVLKKSFNEPPRSGQKVKESPKLVRNTTLEETPRVVQHTTIEETPRVVQNITLEGTPKLVQKTPRPIKQPIITFGKKIITPPPEKPPVFDLEHFMKKGKRSSLKMKDFDEGLDLLPQNPTGPPNKSDGIKNPTLNPSSILFLKRKRGRPSKVEQQQRQEYLKKIFKQEDCNIVENTASADASSSRPLRRCVRGRISKVREMRRFKGRPKFKSLMGTRNKFRGLNRIVFNARKVSHESMLRRQVMAYRKIRLSNALTQTDASETIDDIQESSKNKSDHNYSTCMVEINAQTEVDKANEEASSEKEPKSLKALEDPAFEVEVSTSCIQGSEVSSEMVQDEVAKTPDLNVTSEVIVASEKESNQEDISSSHALTSTPIASFGHQMFGSSSPSDIEKCSVISQVIADFETVTPKQRPKEKPSTKQLSLSSSVRISESTSASTAAPTAVSPTVPIAVSSTVSTTVTSAMLTAVTSAMPTTVTSTTQIAVSSTDQTVVSSTAQTAVSSTAQTATTTIPTVVTSTQTAVSATASSTVTSTVPTAVSTTVTATGPTTATSVPVTVPATSTVSLTKVTTVASTYVPTIVSINAPSAVRPSTPTKTSPNVLSIKLVSSTPDSPVQKSFKLNKKLIYHPENQGSGNSREPTLPPRETEKPVERPITFDELRQSILESSKVPTSLMAVDSVGACTEVVTQDPKKQAPASLPDIRYDGIKVKRPRGRPKKEKNTSLQEPVQTPPPIKRRGRPRKIRVEESAEKAIPSQTEGNNSYPAVDSSTSATLNKPQEEEVSMEVDVASEILRIQGEIPDSDSMRVGEESEMTVGDKSVAVSSERVLNNETDAENDGDISDQALQNKIPENLEKGTSEVKDSNQPEVHSLPDAEEQPESTEKPSDSGKAVTSTPQVIKLVSPENGSAVAEESTPAEESHDASVNERLTDDTPKPKGRRGRKPKRGRKRKSESMLDQSATPITPDQNASPAEPKKRGRGRPKKVVPTEDLSQSVEDRSPADTSLVADEKTVEDTPPVPVRESSADAAVVGVRKSRRSITKKVVTDYSVLEETEIKAKLVEHVPQPTPVKKGNRGRPRKYPLKEPESSAPTTKDPVITRLECAEGVQKRGSRKGRPTKCVDYADLNSGNLDEVDKIIEDLEKSGKVNEVFQGEPEPAHPEKVHDDNFILPPKKRKRVSDAKLFKNTEPLVPEAVPEVPLQEPSRNQTDSLVLEPQSAMVPVEVTAVVPQVYTKLFTEYLPVKDMYKLLTNSEYEAYLPPLKQSICFKVKTFDAESDWVSLGQFTSLPIGETNHYTFFTGGPVSSSAFCPTWEETQYIALCTCTSMLEDNFYDSVAEEKGLIQIWNLGPLTDSGMVHTPTMDLGISHNYGKVMDMTWCPTGAWQDSTKASESLPRLGLLAAAFTDSCIRIYSVPHPNFLERDGKKPPLYFASPCITLEPLCDGPSLGTSKSTCNIVSWQRSNGCEKIAGGYGNGMVCLWLVHSSATICSRSEEERVYFPYKVFQAHGTPITGVSFSPLNERWIVTCSYDKTMKFFDLLDPSIPFCTVKKGFSRKVHWANNYCGAYGCLHDDVVFKGCSFFKECGTEGIGTNNISTPNSLICESALSAVKEYYALADVDGSLIVSVMKNMHHEYFKTTCYNALKIFQTEVVPYDKSSVEPLLIENEVASENEAASECPDDAPQSDPLGGFINSLDSDESDEASLSNSILLVQLLDMLRDQSCELELSVKEKLKALCEPLQDLIDNLEDLDENSYIKFCILDKSFALNREMFDRILVTDAPMDVSLDSREEDIVPPQSEPASKEMDPETTSNSELNIEKQSTDSPLSNEPTKEAQQPSAAEESNKEAEEGRTSICGDSNNTLSESLDKPSAKEKESNSSGDLGSEIESESKLVLKESECLSQSSVPDSKEVEVDSASKEAEIVSQSGASVKEGTVSSLISDPKEVDLVVESKETKSSETHGNISDSSIETISQACVLVSQEKESDSPSGKEDNKTESSVVSDTMAINSAPVPTELDSHKDESVLLQPSESEMETEDVSASTEKPVTLSSDASESKEIKTGSLITDETVSSMLVEKDPESLCQESLSLDSTVISISETSIDSNVQNSRNEILEEATETLMVVDSVSEEVCVDSQNPDESGVMPCVNKSDTLEDAQTNLLPCDSTTENTSNQSGEELLTETTIKSPAKDETMEVDMIPDRELEKQDDEESIFSETLEVDSSDFLDSDSDDSLISECSIETKSADSSEPTSPIMFAEDSMDTARNLMPDPTDKEVRSELASVPTSNLPPREDVTSHPVEEKSVSLEKMPAKESNEITLEVAESNTDQDKTSPKSTTSGDNGSDSILPTQSTSTVEETNKADVEAFEEIILSSSLDIQSVDSSSKLCESEDMEVDPSPQEIVKGSEDRGDVHVELGTESPAVICQEPETIQNMESASENTAGISENAEGVVSISGKTDTTDLVSENTEKGISEDSLRVPESTTNCEIISEEIKTSHMVSESTENGHNIAENTETTDMVSENVKSNAENIKNEVEVPETPESCEDIAENSETIDVINDSSNILYAQPRRPPTKRAFLQGLRWTQAESLFNSTRDIRREEYFPNYKRVKPVKEQYEDFASNHGLVFRDIFLNDPKDLNKGNSIELTDRELHVNSYGVSSINTVSWNPNQGSKCWVFSAGNSGLARLSCLSNIASLEQPTKRKR